MVDPVKAKIKEGQVLLDRIEEYEFWQKYADKTTGMTLNQHSVQQKLSADIFEDSFPLVRKSIDDKLRELRQEWEEYKKSFNSTIRVT